MGLSNFMTATATTTRHPTKDVNNKIGDPVTHLENVKVTPVLLPDSRRLESIKRAIGLEGGLVQIFETYTESHLHTDDSVPVTQLPDILAGDFLTIGSKSYRVRTAEINSESSSFGQTLILILTESRRE